MDKQQSRIIILFSILATSVVALLIFTLEQKIKIDNLQNEIEEKELIEHELTKEKDQLKMEVQELDRERSILLDQAWHWNQEMLKEYDKE